MPKKLSDLPSQGADPQAAIERQQLELRSMSRVIVTSSIARGIARTPRVPRVNSLFEDIARDLARTPRVPRVNSLFEDIARDLARTPRVPRVNSLFEDIARDIARTPRVPRVNSLFEDIARDIARTPRVPRVNFLFRDIGRISPTLFETNVAKDYRRIAEALQAQQQRALRAQRLLSTSPILEALEHIKRTTALCQRQWKSIARSVVGGAFGRDIRGVAESAGNAPASGPSDKLKAPLLARKDAETTHGTRYAVGLVSKEASAEWKITVFLAKLPAYFEPLEDPPPKYQMH